MKTRAVITVAGFLFGYLGPVACIRAGSSLGLKGAVGLGRPGERFIVASEGERETLERFIRLLIDECPWPTRFANKLGIAGGIEVTWQDATGQFERNPSGLPFTQFSLPRRR